MFKAIVIGCSLFSFASFGADIDWHGRYRVEGMFYKNLQLNSQSTETSYLTNHLILQPKIIASDGVNIHSRFDIFNNKWGNNQIGQLMGNYTSAQPPATLTHHGQDETLVVSQLYLNWVGEFGALRVGRVPIDFGLGMKFNSGAGAFDHYQTTKDLVGYEIHGLGNFVFMPAYGKVRESYLNREDDVNDYTFMANYSNPDTDISMGFYFDSRVAPYDSSAPDAGNDFPTSSFTDYGTVSRNDGFSVYEMNFFVKKKTENFNVGVELGFVQGYTGLTVLTSSGANERIELSGFGAAGEIGYKWDYWSILLKAGMASGDDPETPRFEGYFFSPNYDVAMLMFNHQLGQYDVLRTTLAGTRSTTGDLSGIDSEVISNAIYFAPQIKYNSSETVELFSNFTYGVTQKSSMRTSTAGNVASSLGFELDLGVNYHPTDRISWMTQLGVLFPGGAWKGGTLNYAADAAYGGTSKVAISF